MTTYFKDNVEMSSLTVSTTFNPANGSIKNTHVSSASTDRIVAEKLEHQKTIVWTTATSTTTVATVTQQIFLANAAGTLEVFSVRPESAPSGDYQYTIDLKKAADGSGSYATVLSSVVTISSADTAYTTQDGTISSATVTAGDAYQIVITASGTSGTQGAGLTCILVVHEDPA